MYGRTQSRSTGLFLWMCAALLLVAMVSQQSWAAGARGAAKSALAPFESGLTAAGAQLGRVTSVLGDMSVLHAQNQELLADDAALRRRVVELDAAARENAALRQALDFERSLGRRMVAAQVVGLGPDGFSRTLEIDRGTSEGVQAGMIVATGAGLLGRVSEAGPHSAIVQTLAAPQSRVNVFLSRSGLQGTVVGGPTALRMQIEHSIGVVASNGDWAITSGVGGGYPRGLVVGEIASVSHHDAATFDDAVLAWVNDPASISLVLVITDFTPS
ncbi:MAG TPA: rod shape-determining protein MreC [Candidatus Dormibacteraeota bacterium]|nr:rod shape-determining protein MreC [Candidatus Dormibacteraeota bacterium]